MSKKIENQMEYINNKQIVFEHVIKPCLICSFCPYGSIVEYYPITGNEKYRCKVFGHNCPVFYQTEIFSEEGEASEDDYELMYDEFKSKMMADMNKIKNLNANQYSSINNPKKNNL